MPKLELEELTTEIESTVKEIPQTQGFTHAFAPLRLLVVWMKTASSDLKQLRKELRELREYLQSDDENLVK
ncbi:hypothetical protein [Enterovibrio norvegicus]|uniref:hypothetical protein n=1 Tax=Enterovibrio norvegicus TaxID=188144 RepID=UPI000C83A3C2|nr:hypothetical protein [Enterovibrio norvegicus]PMH65392.1 hypothetical protein BCU62_13140 [Enterovibrio norvegicus]